jgi:hypothetical protein
MHQLENHSKNQSDDECPYSSDNGIDSGQEREDSRQQVPDSADEARKKRAQLKYESFVMGLWLKQALNFQDHMSYKFLMHQNERAKNFEHVFDAFYLQIERQIDIIYRETRNEINKVYPLENLLKLKHLTFDELVSYSELKNSAPVLYIGSIETPKDATYADCTLEKLSLPFKPDSQLTLRDRKVIVDENLIHRHFYRPLNLQPVKFVNRELIKVALKQSIAMSLYQLDAIYGKSHIHVNQSDEEDEFHKLSFVAFVQRPRLINLNDIFNSFDDDLRSETKVNIAQWSLHPLGERRTKQTEPGYDDFKNNTLSNSREHGVYSSRSDKRDRVLSRNRLRLHEPAVQKSPALTVIGTDSSD